PAGAGAGEVRDRDQPKDCQGARHRNSANRTRPRRRCDRMKRREFITLLGGAAAWPLAARAQEPGKVIRIGYLGPSLNVSGTATVYRGFLSDRREAGFKEGQNLVVEYQRIDDPRGPFIAAAELVLSQPNLIVAHGPEIALQAVIGASGFVPIVVIAIN